MFPTTSAFDEKLRNFTMTFPLQDIADNLPQSSLSNENYGGQTCLNLYTTTLKAVPHAKPQRTKPTVLPFPLYQYLLLPLHRSIWSQWTLSLISQNRMSFMPLWYSVTMTPPRLLSWSHAIPPSSQTDCGTLFPKYLPPLWITHHHHFWLKNAVQLCLLARTLSKTLSQSTILFHLPSTDWRWNWMSQSRTGTVPEGLLQLLVEQLCQTAPLCWVHTQFGAIRFYKGITILPT